MFQNTMQIPCIHTCDAEHDHGSGFAELTWVKNDPLAVSVSALSRFGVALPLLDNNRPASTFYVARDTLHTAVRSGRSYGCPVVGQGNVTCQVLENHITTLAIRWSRRGFIMWVDRDTLSRWIDETYTIVPVSIEDERCNVDAIISRILESK